jgi:hypothetical protein
MASWPIPENHLDTFPWRIRSAFFFDKSRLYILLYKSKGFVSKIFLSKVHFIGFITWFKDKKI